MAEDKTAERVSIAFEGGQVLDVRLTQKALDALGGALGGEGWHDLAVEEGSVRLNLDKVVYVRVQSSEHRVGFGL